MYSTLNSCVGMQVSTVYLIYAVEQYICRERIWWKLCSTLGEVCQCPIGQITYKLMGTRRNRKKRKKVRSL